MNLAEMRFNEDVILDVDSKSQKLNFESRSNKARRGLYSNSVLVTKELFPDLHQVLVKVSDTLAIDSGFEAFVKPDPVPQANCIKVNESYGFALVMTSSLIQLLTLSELQFVVGHEIGHYVFQHHLKPSPNDAESEQEFLQHVYHSRCSEISADRVGFLASPSIDDSMMAILKVASGLDKEHLKLNVVSYLEQMKHIENLDGYVDNAYSSHPVFPLRMRALLWFSMSEPYQQFLGADKAAVISKEKLDRKVSDDLHRMSDKYLTLAEDKNVEYVLLWTSIKLALFDKKFTQLEQEAIRNLVGRSMLEKALSFIKNSSQNIEQIVDERFHEAVTKAQCLRSNKLNELKNQIKEVSEYLDVTKKQVDLVLSKLN